MNLSKNVKITKVAAAAVSAGTAVNGNAVDMQNFEGVLFFTTIATANAGNYLKVQQDSDVALGTVADLADSAVVATANAEVVFVDVYKPTERYVRPVVIRAGANTAVGEIYAIQYEGRVRPSDNDITDTIVGTLLVSAAEGTA